MERSPSTQFASSSPSDEQKNGSIFRRMYNSLHRPKKGSDPFVDIAERFEQENIREQRKKDVQQRSDHAKQKQHYTISGTEEARAQSWKGDTKTQFGWQPPPKLDASFDASELSTIPVTTASSPAQLQSNNDSTTDPSPPPTTPTSSQSTSGTKHKKQLTRGHSLTSSSVILPSSQPAPPSIPQRRFSLRTEALPSNPTPIAAPVPVPINNEPKVRPEKTKSTPPKPNATTFKEFRPEKKERVDMDQLRQSYESTSNEVALPNDSANKNKGKSRHNTGSVKRNPSRNGVGPDKPMNGVVTTIASSRLPSTILPGLQLLHTDEVRKSPMNRPRHPYIPKKVDSTGSLFGGTLRSSSAGKNNPRKQSPATASVSDTSTPSKSIAIPIKEVKKETRGADEGSKSISPRNALTSSSSSTSSPSTHYELPRSHTESLVGVYKGRQRSNHATNSPPTTRFPTTSPNHDRPSSPPSSSSESERLDGYVSIRRKPKARNINDSLTPSSRNLLKAKNNETKKMYHQVVTAKDLAAFGDSEPPNKDGKTKLEKLFDPPETKGSATRPASSPSSPPPPSHSSTSPPRTTLSSTSSPANIPNPPPFPSAKRPKKAPLYPKKSPSTQLAATTPPSSPPSSLPSSPSSSLPSSPINSPRSDSPPSPSSTSSAPSPPKTSPAPPLPTAPLTSSSSTSNIPISSAPSRPYQKPPYMLAKSASKSLASKTSDSDNTPSPARTRAFSGSDTIQDKPTSSSPSSSPPLSRPSSTPPLPRPTTSFPRSASEKTTPHAPKDVLTTGLLF